MSEHYEVTNAMVRNLKNMDRVQTEMWRQLDLVDSEMRKLIREYQNFSDLGGQTGYKPIFDLVMEIRSIDPISYGQNIKELKYEIETSRQDLMTYQSFLQKLV
ncbi:hypothetical protein [Leuconostoc citreum]|uniref:hypothetical protein n=1 Tax=Leuconostoc citreum TaxID=33964 RepID=UPI000246638E|nr:hypothetical protein [Leuconostoc citreum]CCF27460.1 Protein of unknown function [Leuconostoc citreum LBAE C11]